MERKRIFIVGPTAVGKSSHGIRLAQDLHGAILSMDSMQIYRGMDIGTAKVTPDERRIVPHALIDIAAPDASFSVHDYQQHAKCVQDACLQNGRWPIYVGGTGLYLDALLRDFHFHEAEPQKDLRERLECEYDADGGEALYRSLFAQDPALAARLSTRDRPRLIRAHEVLAQKEMKHSLSEATDGVDRSWQNLIFVLHRPRERLYRAIDARVTQMLEAGLVDEVSHLIAKGVPRTAQAMRAIGYRETLWYLRGLVSPTEHVALIQRFSRNYAKRQLTWFRKTPEAIWLDVEEEDVYETMLAMSRRFLSSTADKGAK